MTIMNPTHYESISVTWANDWIFWWSIVEVLSLTRNSSSDVMLSLCTILRALSCSLFILSFICLPWNIHTSRQYLNCASVKALKAISLFLKNLATLVKALSFLLPFEQILNTCLSNFSLLFNVIPRSLTSLLSQTISLSNYTHICPFLFSDTKRRHLSVLIFM